jgi:hypothetical protein
MSWISLVFCCLLIIYALGILKLKMRRERFAKWQETTRRANDWATRRAEEEQRRADEANELAKRRAEEACAEFNKMVQQATAILERNNDLVGKLLSIAESKVSILDEYGDENWDELPNEIKVCLKKMANRDYRLASGAALRLAKNI